MENKKGVFDFTGSEKAAVALGPVVLPLTVLVGTILAYFKLGVMPDPLQIRDAIVYFLLTAFTARLVWQVPNSGVVKADTVEVKVDPTANSQVAVKSDNVEEIKVNPADEEPVKISTIEETPA